MKEVRTMKENLPKHKKILKPLIFILLFLAVLPYFNSILQPDWLSWNNYDTTHGFYEQPDNTIETVFLGASIAVNGFTPMELYEDYGISAWNLATEQQPMLASYYWLKEAYRYHPETLKTVVLDTSMLRTVQSEAYYEKALLGMRFSANKYQAIRDCTDTLDKFVSYLFPVFAYHTRWKELEKSDFTMLDYETNTAVRGYNFVTGRVIDTYKYNTIGIPSYLLNESAAEQRLAEESLFYLKKTIQFCEEKGLKLLLAKTPGSINWTDSAHNAVQSIADEYGLSFLDFNYRPYIDEIGYCEALDSLDMRHMNYYGASKLTKWFGNYLVENCGATDVRGQERYQFLEEELLEYLRETVSLELDKVSDPCEYIKAVNSKGNFTIFLSVKDDGANALTQEQREGFEEIGLKQLAGLSFRASYLAVIEDGEVLCEKLERSKEPETAEYQKAEEFNDLENIEEAVAEESEEESELLEEEEKLYLEYKGVLPGGKAYTLNSGGAYLGNVSSCVIDGTEYSKGQRGINMVVYDNISGKVADAAVFDTCASSERNTMEEAIALANSGAGLRSLTGTAKQLYLYNTRCSDVYRIRALKYSAAGTSLYQYLKALIEDENYVIFLSAKGDAAGMLEEEAREAFGKLGLSELSQLRSQEPYLAVIDGGKILTEKRGNDQTAIEEDGVEYKVISGANQSSIRISNTEYSKNFMGINVVVYNKNTKFIIDTTVFDTSRNPVAVD